MHLKKNQAKTLTQRNLEHEYASQLTIRREESNAEGRLLLGVTHHRHQGAATLGVSSLTFWGSTNFISLRGHEGRDVPGNFWQPCRKGIVTGDGVLPRLNLASPGVTAVLEEISWHFQFVCRSLITDLTPIASNKKEEGGWKSRVWRSLCQPLIHV